MVHLQSYTSILQARIYNFECTFKMTMRNTPFKVAQARTYRPNVLNVRFRAFVEVGFPRMG